MIRLLTVCEIESIGEKASFALAAVARVETMDYRPIDAAAGLLESVWAAAVRQNPAEFPTCAFRGALGHSPPPEGIRSYCPESKRDGWTEPVGFDIQGATDGSTCILLLTRIKNIDAPAGLEPCSPRLFGLDDQGSKLISRRSLDSSMVEKFADAVPGLLAQAQARDLDSVALPPARSANPRKL